MSSDQLFTSRGKIDYKIAASLTNGNFLYPLKVRIFKFPQISSPELSGQKMIEICANFIDNFTGKWRFLQSS